MVVAGLVSKGTYYGLGARDLATSCISTIIVIVGLFAMCRPIRVNWDAKAGTCSPPIVITSLSYLVSAAAVATDWVCAILPGFMLQGPDENSNQGFYQYYSRPRCPVRIPSLDSMLGHVLIQPF
jgi:hypothetical protein